MQQLSEQGFHVVTKPRVYGSFAPNVCLNSAAEAHRLVTQGTIMIRGMTVDVRCYKPLTKKIAEKREKICRRSVFLGGLRTGTTSQMIKKELLAFGVKIVKKPLVKKGFCPQVTMATPEQARMLIEMVKLKINGKLVDVRPYGGVCCHA